MQFDIQFLFNFFHQFKPVFPVTIHFIYKNNDRSIPHPADFRQFPGLFFNTIDAINHQYNAVHCRQCPISIFRKVLMAWCIQQIDELILVLKTHNRSGHGDTTLTLYFHEITGSMFSDFIAFNSAGCLNSTSE